MRNWKFINKQRQYFFIRFCVKLFSHQFVILVKTKHISIIICKAVADVFFQAIITKPMIVRSVFTFHKFIQIIFGIVVHCFGQIGCIAVNTKMIFYPADDSTCKKGVLNIHPVFPCSTGQHYRLVSGYQKITYSRYIWKRTGNNLFSCKDFKPDPYIKNQK